MIPSRCRVDASVKCPDGVTDGGPGALKAFVAGPVASTLARSDIFAKDGATVVTWDRPAAGRAPTDPLGALVLSAFTRPGASNSSAYTTFSLTATVQRRFGLAGDPGQPAMLGLSAKAKPFGPEVFPKQ